ncbi:cold shock domain-containing protein [Pseudarthrobacter oxydans]|uniref:cold shock domain-containing protein n=1 Tax=Pseudarthrobacter oxydans TaxID=1671 RepID=UPI00103E6A0B
MADRSQWHEVAIIGDMYESWSKGTVKTWHREEGWGSIQVEGVAAECFAHFSCIIQKTNEFLELVPGEAVRLTWHEAQQDEFSIVADRVERS